LSIFPNRSTSSFQQTALIISPVKALPILFLASNSNLSYIGFGAGYTQGKGTSYALGKERAKRNEWSLDASYKYSKKLTFLSWYAAAKDKKDGESYTITVNGQSTTATASLTTQNGNGMGGGPGGR